MELGNIIRENRKKSKLTLKELAYKVGVSEQAISQYERNKRTPSTNMIKKISEVLGVNLLTSLREELDVHELFVDTAEYMVKYCKFWEFEKDKVIGFTLDEVDEFYQETAITMLKILKKRKSAKDSDTIFCPPDDRNNLFIEID